MKEIKLKGLNETIYEHTTKEGLKVYMWVNDKIKSAYMALSVRYGSIDTKFKINNATCEVPNGIAHFLEHIKFNVNDSTTAHDLFYKIGSDANAFTTFKYTSYMVFTTDKKKESLNTLLDFVYNPYFTTKMINKEKGIIIEEANMGDDDPYSLIFYKSLQNTFKNSKYRNKITGTKEDIKNINLKDIKLVYNTFYHPKNMFLTIMGNINPYEMALIVDKNLSKKEFNEYQNPIVIKDNEPNRVVKEYDEVLCNVTYPNIKYNIKIPLNKFKGIHPLLLKAGINLILNINLGSTSEFKDELLTKGLIDSMYYSTNIFDDYVLISLNIVTKYVKEVINRVEDKLQNLEINEKDMRRKKNAALAGLILGFEDIEIVSNHLESDLIEYGDIIDNQKELLENQSTKDIENILDKIDYNNVSINLFMPKNNQDN